MSRSNEQNLKQVAKVLKSYGTDGKIVLSFRYYAPEDINIEEPVFIYFDGLPVPFFIDSFVKRGSNRAFAHITDVNSFEDAEELVGKAVYMDATLLDAGLEEDDLSFLIGWTLLKPYDGTIDEDNEAYIEDDLDSEPYTEKGNNLDGELEDYFDEELKGEHDNELDDDFDSDIDNDYDFIVVGEITHFLDIPNNPCLEVQTEEGELIVPFHEDLVLSLDPDNKEIIINIPEGLL